MEALVPAALILLALAPVAGMPAEPAPPAPAGVRLAIESLDLALTTPERWRISSASRPDELVLVAGTERAAVHLRVRRTLSAHTPRELMRELALELGEPYARVEFESETTRQAGEREVALLRATAGSGREELHVRLFVARIAPGSRHLFWLDGSPRDVQRALEEVVLCIAGASPAAVVPAGEAPDLPGAEAVVRHRPSGLVVERHPRGLAPLSILPAQLDRDGLVWAAAGPEAPLATLTLTRRSVSPLVDEATAAASLASELRRDPAVEDLTSALERLASQPARRLAWRRTDEDGAHSCETWFFKAGSSLFRLDVAARGDWLAKNQAALEDFRRGLRLAEQR